ncbi:MAG: tetratricopeptide repeat protein [Okeania sp. SIO2F4]|uniref:tetratricopeptide repeat protein n=1 Tax=Okeania sp. SIO2F4 TaxID=2607790 RepID=UPI001429C659|nr:tetratricopeptide repeat protein [Okeania sp. SIO2F4]NES01422.1 tetratricopeptide repeat protein [Okeania sp. SIO2F4]
MNVKQAKNFFCLGKVFVKKGEWEEAIAAYHKAIKLAPDWEEVKQYLADAENKLQQQEAREKLTIAEQFGQILATQGKSHLEKVAFGNRIKVDSNLVDDYHLQGDTLVEKGEKEEAIKVYRKAVEIKPELWEVHHKLGNLLQEKEELEAAVAAYDKSIELKSDFPWGYYKLGDVLVKLEEWDGAVSAYRCAIQLNFNLPFIEDKLANSLHKQARIIQELAFNYYLKAIQKHPQNIELYYKALEIKQDINLCFDLASILAQKAKFDEAIIIYQSITEIDSSSYEAYLQLGNCLTKQNKFDIAISMYKKALELNKQLYCLLAKIEEVNLTRTQWDVKLTTVYKLAIKYNPNCFKYYDEIGDIFIKDEQLDEGIYWYREALKIKPFSWETYQKLGDIFSRKRNYEDAILMYKSGLEIQPESVDIYKKIKQVIEENYAITNNSKYYIDSYQDAIKRFPDSSEIYWVLAQELDRQNNIDLSLSYYNYAISIEPKCFLFNYSMGNALIKKMEWGEVDIPSKQYLCEKAIKVYKNAIDINPNYTKTYQKLGNALAKQSRFEEAAAVYNSLIQIYPDYFIAYHQLGNLLMKQGKFQEAIENYRYVITLNPKFHGVYNLLGEALQQEGQLTEAIACYKKAIQLRPDIGIGVYKKLAEALAQKKFINSV